MLLATVVDNMQLHACMLQMLMLHAQQACRVTYTAGSACDQAYIILAISHT